MRVLPAAACFFAAIQGASAAAIQPFAAPTGIGITLPAPGKDGTYDFSTATTPKANWAANQWGNPDTLFPPFTTRRAAGVTNYYSVTTRGLVQASMAADGQFLFKLNQNGQSLACGGAVAPDEFDLFLAPNSASFNPDYPSATLADVNPNAVPSLGAMGSLWITGSVRLSRNWVPPVPSKCVVNQGSVIYSLILQNTRVSPPQLLFYQIDLTRLLCAPGTDPYRYAWCQQYPFGFSYFEASSITSGGKIVRTQYGLDDPITSFGGNMLQVSVTATAYNLNLLPRLKAVIQAGSPPVPGVAQMDTNPSDWTLNKMYFGQHIWGDIGLETEWHGLLPIVQ